MTDWVQVCAADDIEEEDVIRFDHGDRTFAVYRSPDDEYFATDGLCTHEKIHLADFCGCRADRKRAGRTLPHCGLLGTYFAQ